MNIKTFVLGSLETNSYMLLNEQTNEVVIIDPAESPDYVIHYVKSKAYIPKAILLTHGHFDHVMGIEGWVKEFQIPVYIYGDERQLLATPQMNMSAIYSTSYSYDQVIGLEDGKELHIAGFVFRVIHTPGHTGGSCCYYCEQAGVLFSGDTLFRRCVGRSDLPTGDQRSLISSIRQNLWNLPDEVSVYPGHGASTSIKDEKKHNPYVQEVKND